MKKTISNGTPQGVLCHLLIAFFSLFLNGIGVYLTIHADIGAGPWDVLNLGLSETFGILYGNANVAVSFSVLLIDLLLREPIGIAMVVDALTVGKTVDLCNRLAWVPQPKNFADGLLMCLVGLFIIAYTQYFYMRAALGCGPRDTLTVALKKRLPKVPVGVIAVAIQSLVTFVGYLLGGKVGVGTLLWAFAFGPILQFAFYTVRFDVAAVKHQTLWQTVKVFLHKKPRND